MDPFLVPSFLSQKESGVYLTDLTKIGFFFPFLFFKVNDEEATT